jgi:hypothetical protein
MKIVVCGWIHHKNKYGLQLFAKHIPDVIVEFYEKWEPNLTCELLVMSGEWVNPDKIKGKILYGPHICNFASSDLPYVGKPEERWGERCSYNALSPLVKRYLIETSGSGFKIPIVCLPFPVEIPTIRPQRSKDFHVLIYTKFRSENEIDFIKSKLNCKTSTFRYGQYRESQYRYALRKAHCAVWIGSSESQGFALQECWAANVPTFIWDTPILRNWLTIKDHDESILFPCSTRSVWDKQCGEFMYQKYQWDDKWTKFTKNLKNYTPKQFIIKHLSTKSCWEKWLAWFQSKPIPNNLWELATVDEKIEKHEFRNNEWEKIIDNNNNVLFRIDASNLGYFCTPWLSKQEIKAYLGSIQGGYFWGSIYSK